MLGPITYFDHVAFLDAVGRNVNLLAVHADVAVVYELTCGENGCDELGAVHNGVQAALEQTDQVFTCIAFYTLGFTVNAAELLFGQIAVVALELLLGAKLDTEVGNLALAALAMLAGAVFATVYRGFRTAPDVFAHTAVNFVLGSCAFCHGCSPFCGPRRIATGGKGRCPLAEARQGSLCRVHQHQ